MKLVHKLAIATLMLSGIAQVQLAMAIGDPIPGIDIVVKPGGGIVATDPSKPKNVESVGPAGAPINTTRSNIRRPAKAETAEANDALMGVSTTRGITVKGSEQPVEPPGAPVNTTRSNKRR